MMVALISILVGFAIYGFGCYINYRIVSKFDNTISFLENLIPLWNVYLLVRVAVNNPVAYFWSMLLVPIFIGLVGAISNSELISFVGQIVWCVMSARVFGLIAEQLGKNFWLYAILSVIPVINLIVMCILAFDDSRPVVSTESLPVN